ncbi:MULTISPECIES: hypothetical protein [unclassified Microbacterium]|uniref:hypothetical protein n=1 Tax=unclassified Microbacterium TaxID=2609290 RepID=UPI00364712DA
MSLPEVANWLQEHPPGNLISTRHAPVSEDPDSTSTTIGYIPAQGAQQGIVYTVEKMPDGVAVRAEIAAQASTATCPPLPSTARPARGEVPAAQSAYRLWSRLVTASSHR